MNIFAGKKWVPWVIGASAFIVVVGSTVGVFSYLILVKQMDTPFIRQVAAAVHFPVARVGSHYVTYMDYLAHLDAETQFVHSPTARAQGVPDVVNGQVRSDALDRAMRVAAVEDMAQKAGIEVTPLDESRAFDDLFAQAQATSTPAEIHDF